MFALSFLLLALCLLLLAARPRLAVFLFALLRYLAAGFQAVI